MITSSTNYFKQLMKKRLYQRLDGGISTDVMIGLIAYNGVR